MTEIQLTKISKTMAGRPLFEIDKLTATMSDHIGIVGRNGSGKSTLAHILTGDDQDYSGQLIVDEAVVYVPQIAPKAKQAQFPQPFLINHNKQRFILSNPEISKKT